MRYVDLEARARLLGDRLRAAAVHRPPPPRLADKSAALRISLKQRTVDNARAVHRAADAAARAAIGTREYDNARSQLVTACVVLDTQKRALAELVAARSHATPPADPAQIRRQLEPAILEAAAEIVALLGIVDLILDGFDGARAALPPGVRANGLTSAVLIRNDIKHARQVTRDLRSPVPV